MPNNPNDPVLSPGCSVPTPKVPQQQLVLQNGMKTVVGGLRGMVRSMIGCDATSGVKSVRPASPVSVPQKRFVTPHLLPFENWLMAAEGSDTYHYYLLREEVDQHAGRTVGQGHQRP